MSLDVEIQGKKHNALCHCECGHQHYRYASDVLFAANITHNLGAMAKEAGIYAAVWRPEECGIETTDQLVPILRNGLELMEKDPPRSEALNAENGWGLYENFVPWLRRYLDACIANPGAKVRASR